MKVENGHIYYTIDDIVDLLDAIKVDGANKLTEHANLTDNMALQYAVVGYNSAMRKIRRDFENIDDQFRKELKMSKNEENNISDTSEGSTQDHKEQSEINNTNAKDDSTKHINSNKINSNFAPI